MNISLDWIIVAGMWAAQIFYVLCYFPQIIKNFQCKFGRGISDWMLLGYFWCLVAVVYYVFLYNLPLAYKILPPLQLVAIIILVFQRLLYDEFTQTKPYWVLYGSSMLGSLMFIPIASKNPLEVGWGAGWLMFIIACIYQLPQIIKIFKQKNVVGFSLLFVVFLFIASAIEFTTAWVIGLPIQTLFTAFRGVVICLIWFVQFRIYR